MLKHTKLQYTQRMKLHTIAITALLGLSPFLSPFLSPNSNGQAALDNNALVGTWESSLTINREQLNIALTLEVEQGTLNATLTSDGLGVFGLPADSAEVDGLRFNVKFLRLGAEVSGWLRLNDEKDQITRIDGDWFQSAELVPIVLLPASTENL